MRGVPGTTPGHGTVARYNNGCHCQACRDAISRYETIRRMDADAGKPRLLSSIGTVRRLQALAAIGWPETILGERMGVSRTRVQKVRRGAQEQVRAITRTEIATLFDQLCMTPGPSAITRSRALRAGWFPPLAWDDIDDPTEVPQIGGIDDEIDEIAVERAMDGRRVTLTLAERIEVVRRLTAQGWSDAQVAEVLGLTERTVTRDRAKHGIESMWRAAA